MGAEGSVGPVYLSGPIVEGMLSTHVQVSLPLLVYPFRKYPQTHTEVIDPLGDSKLTSPNAVY